MRVTLTTQKLKTINTQCAGDMESTWKLFKSILDELYGSIYATAQYKRLKN